MSFDAVTGRPRATAAWLAGRLVRHDRRIGAACQGLAGERPAGGRDAGVAGRPARQPSRLRSFDSARVAVVVIILLPVVLAYQTWTYYVFRRRVSKSEFQPPEPARAAAPEPQPRPAAPPVRPGH